MDSKPATKPAVRIRPFAEGRYRVEIDTVVDAAMAIELVKTLGYRVGSGGMEKPKTDQW